MKFLIIQTAFIGDVILATSLIEKLHEDYPEARIDMLVRKGNEKLLEYHPFIHEIIIWDKKAGKYRSLIKTIKKIRKNKYDHLINCQRFASSGIISLFAKAKIKSGFKKNPISFCYDYAREHEIGNGKHEIERNYELIRHIAKNHHIPKPELYPSKINFTKSKAFTEGQYIVMAPASVWYTKQLPIEKWLELIEKTQKKYNIYLVGSPDDKNICNKIIQHVSGKKPVNLAGKLSLLDTAAMMKNAKMNFVNDSAPLHLATAMNAPVTAFFCSTVPEFGFGPLSEVSVIAQTEKNLDCRPCGLHGKKECPQGHFKCALTIDIKKIAIKD